MKLDSVGSEHLRLSDGFRCRVDEEARAYSGRLEPGNSCFGALGLAEHIQPAFGSNLFTLLGHERDLLRSNSKRDVDHFVGARCLEIEVGRDRRCECVYVGVLYVAPVLAQMRGDPIGACELTHRGSFDYAWLGPATRLSQRRDMIDVYVQSKMSCWHLHGPLGSHHLSWSSA